MVAVLATLLWLQQDIPGAAFPLGTCGRIAFFSLPLVLTLNAWWQSRGRLQQDEQIFADGQVRSIVGHVQVTRRWHNGEEDTRGHHDTLLVGSPPLSFGVNSHEPEELGRLLVKVFGLSMPPEQSTWEYLRGRKQVLEDRSRTYNGYYFEDAWGHRHLLSIEEVGTTST